jgi:hypothetical protein
MTNKVNKSFLKDSHLIAELKLCSIRLIDNAKFPWIILIPKRKNITDISELNSKDQMLLMKEIVHCSKLMKKARFKKDSSWPLSVWVVKGKPYSKILLDKNIAKIKKLF